VASLHESGAAKSEQPRPSRLVCVECRRVAKGDATGWRAYRTVEDHVVMFCPTCATREFGSS
jgi:hypothetical protein